MHLHRSAAKVRPNLPAEVVLMTSDRGTSTSHRPAYDWMSSAICAQVGWHDHFLDYDAGDNPSRITRARRLCRSCDVARECLDHAMALETEHGMAGGMIASDRRLVAEKLRRDARNRAAQAQPEAVGRRNGLPGCADTPGDSEGLQATTGKATT